MFSSLSELVPKVRLPFTALISPHLAPAVAAKVMGTLRVTKPVLWFSIFDCVPPKSKSEMEEAPELFRTQLREPVQSNRFWGQRAELRLGLLLPAPWPPR